MGIFRQFPYSNFHEMNMDEIIKIVNNLSDEWKKYTAQWASGIDTEYLITPEMYGAVGDGGTDDSAAFQAMLDDLTLNGGTVILKQTYLIQAPLIIKRNSDWNTPITFIGLGEYSTMIMNSPIKGLANNYGNIKFINVRFTGNIAFLCDHTLIRVLCLSCTFDHMNSVCQATHIVQSMYFIGCIVRECDYLIDGRLTSTSCYDVKINDCLIEHGGYCYYYPNANTYMLVIDNNCIEGMSGSVATLQTSRTAVISNNYFEDNAEYIVLTVNNTGNVIVENNNIVESQARSLVTLPNAVNYPASVKILNNNITDPYTPFTFFTTLSAGQDYTGLIASGNNKIDSTRVGRALSSIELNEQAPFVISTPEATYPAITDVLQEVANYAKNNYKYNALFKAQWKSNVTVVGAVYVDKTANRIYTCAFDFSGWKIGMRAYNWSDLSTIGSYHAIGVPVV